MTPTRRMTQVLTLLACGALGAAPASADDDHVRQRALTRLESSEPSVDDAVVAALRYAGLGGRPEAAMRRRARLSALLPTLTLRASRDTDWSEADDGGRVVGEVDHGLVLEAKATWRLDRLMFDGSELRISSLTQQRARARAAVAAQTTALYYKRRSAQVDQLWQPPETTEEEIRRDLAFEELTAQLDALTGGWWGEQGR